MIKYGNRVAGWVSVCTFLLCFTVALADTYVTKPGSAAPEPNSSVKPYMLIESAVRGSSNANVVIEDGVYREFFTLDVGTTLKASGTHVKIGDLSVSSSTTLEIITLNTHLYGDLIFGDGTFKDDTRAVDIADITAGFQANIVSFQEVWDEDLFWGGDGQTGILPHSGYGSGDHGSGTDCLGCINSGLATMSLHDMVGKEQHYFSDCPGNPCDGIDCMSAKGWIKQVLFIDGFRIVVVNTHVQAGNSAENATTRRSQLGCLFNWVEDYRQQSPDTVVFVVGDLNIVGEQQEYEILTNTVLPSMARDAARNAPQWKSENGGYTNSPANPFALCFDDTTFNARLDYIYFFPSLSGQVKVLPRSTVVLPFRGAARTDDCSDGPSDPLTTTEKSDHWGVHASFELYRE